MRYQLVVRFDDGSGHRLDGLEDPQCIFSCLDDCRARARELWNELVSKPGMVAFVASEGDLAVAVEVCEVGSDRALLSLPLPLPTLQRSPVQ